MKKNFVISNLDPPLVRPIFSDWPCNSLPKMCYYRYHWNLLNILHTWNQVGVLASEGWWQAWQPSPKVTSELLVVRDKVGRPPGELGVSRSVECDIFPSVLWHCWLGDRKDIWPVKKLDVGLLVVWLDWSFAQLIAPVVQLSPPPPSSFKSINTG